MKSFKQEYVINAPAGKVWEALVDPKVIEKWGGGPAKMSDKEGDAFSLWGGDIWGKNKKVVPEKMLVQEWYGGDWKEPSIVTFTLSDQGGRTLLSLVHGNLPDAGWEEFADGWKEYYCGPLKELVEK
ncbi:MAG: SRPBCC domain-containing protein [Patescibacteria group bacterium]